MSKTRWLIFGLITAIMVIAGVAGVSSAYYNDTETSTTNVVRTINNWYDLAWHWRKPLTITNGGSALSNFQIKLTVDTLTPVNAGKMLASGNDIRFSASDGMTNLPYWIESGMNTASTVIWVKVASIPAGGSTIYMYYGNTSAAAASSGTSTFVFFDNFENGLGNWNISGSGTNSNITPPFWEGAGAMYLNDNNAAANKNYTAYCQFGTAQTRFAVEFRARPWQTTCVWEMRVNNGATIGPRLKFDSVAQSGQYYIQNCINTTWTNLQAYTAGNYYIVRLDNINTTTATDTYDTYIDNVSRATGSRFNNNYNAASLNRIYFTTTASADSGALSVDLVKVYAVSATPPTYSIGAEQ